MRKIRLTCAALVCAASIWAPSALAETVVRLHTSLGNIDIKLYEDKAPLTSANFLKLVDDGFYEGLIFHRVLANFMIQAGGFEPNLTYREAPGTVPNESKVTVRNVKRSVAMARQSDPDSADAQFFINVVNNGHLDATRREPGYTVFGEVVAGWDVVVEIELTDVSMRQGMAGVPDKPVIIHKAVRL